MNRGKAEDVRDSLNGKDFVAPVDPDEPEGDAVFRLARIHQTGYANQEPFFEVLLDPTTQFQHGGSTYLPPDFLRWVADTDHYLRVDDDGTVHVRDRLAP